jgi:uncharacterized protein (DUF1800 family)
MTDIQSLDDSVTDCASAQIDEPIDTRASSSTPAGLISTAVLSTLAASALSACGEGDGSELASGGSDERASAAAVAPITYTAWPNPTDDFSAWRFLQQATMGSTPADIVKLRAAGGYEGWINAQLLKAAHTDTPGVQGYPKGSYAEAYAAHNLSLDGLNVTQLNFVLWGKARFDEDQLRRRVVHALSQFLVVSTKHEIVGRQVYLAAGYLDMLSKYAFTNYRDLMVGIATSPAMAHYLTHFANLPPVFEGPENQTIDPTNPPALVRVPDQNFARELLQLFTIGLTKLNMDGTEVKVGGKAVATTTATDIAALSNVFTGWAYDRSPTLKNPLPYRRAFTLADGFEVVTTETGEEMFDYYQGAKQYAFEGRADFLSPRLMTPLVGYDKFTYKVVPWQKDALGHPLRDGSGNILYEAGSNYAPQQVHSTQTLMAAQLKVKVNAVTLLGKPFTLSTLPKDSLNTALDIIFAHPNLAPFVAKQMIQQLVTSNPSKAYVQRVATAFKNSSWAMPTLIKSILLDAEARQTVYANANTFGLLREPFLRVVGMMRAIDWAPCYPEVTDYMVSPNLALNLNQSPLRAPSVFNDYSPSYQRSGSLMSAQGKVSPQMQMATESAVIAYINAVHAIIESGISPSYTSGLPVDNVGEGSIDMSKLSPLISTPANAVKLINTRLFGGAMSAELKSIVQTAATGAINPTSGFKAALFTAVVSTQYLVQR